MIPLLPSAAKEMRYNQLYMDIAERISEMSYAVRLKVGCVLVKDGAIISFGWNGMPADWSNECEYKEFMDRGAGGWLDPEEIERSWPFEGTYIDSTGNLMKGRYRLKTKPEVLHAEMNCLSKVAKTTISTEGSVMYLTHAPCIECAKFIHQAGIRKLYFKKHYRNDDGLVFLRKCGVSVWEL